MKAKLFVLITKRRLLLGGGLRKMVAFEKEDDARDALRRSSAIFTKSSVVPADLVASGTWAAARELEDLRVRGLSKEANCPDWGSEGNGHLGRSAAGRHGGARRF